MPVITYAAVDRGELVGGHTAGTEYQIETELQQFPRELVRKGQFDETLDGTPEGYLHALQKDYPILSDLVLIADREDWREFLTSVAAGEEFMIDFTGTIASPGTDVDVSLVDQSVREQQIGGAYVQYAFRVRAAG